MKKPNVLIITYYWPPAGGPGVQRWLKFAKYLPSFGINPIIYTPENPSYPIIDTSLEKEIPASLQVVRRPIWEPYQIAEKINPKAKFYKAGHFEKKEKQSFLTKLSVFIRGNFFIPDARKFWVKPSVKFLRNYVKENSIDTIITTGPPHSLHLIGLHLKSEYPSLKWMADFRDPWTDISYHSELKLMASSAKKHKELERKVMESADVVLATSFTDASNYQKLGAKRVEVVTNGFEEEDFQGVNSSQNSTFQMTYSGGLEIARNPLALWKALKELVQESEEFRNQFELVFYGSLSEEVRRSMEEHDLRTYLVTKGYVSHQEAIQGIQQANLLLLTNFPDEKSRGIIPGKLFEYMATSNPILAIGPANSDVERILKETVAGRYFLHLEKDAIKEYIFSVFENWQKGIAMPQSTEVSSYSRKALTEKLASLISSMD